MARYIDADRIVYWIRYVSSNGLERDVRRVAFSDEIARIPTADVVPKSEVDLYRKQVDELEDELASTYDKLENAKAEIAREIFEEIEQALFNNHDLDIHSDYPTPHYYEELKDDIAELKKKYTEVDNEIS